MDLSEIEISSKCLEFIILGADHLVLNVWLHQLEELELNNNKMRKWADMRNSVCISRHGTWIYLALKIR